MYLSVVVGYFACFGNLFITVLNRVVGDFNGSIEELNRLLRVRGRVIPACEGRVSLVAHHPDGSKSTGEVQITKSGKPILLITAWKRKL